MVKIIVTGAAGKMGQRIIANLAADPSARIVGGVEPAGSSHLGQDAGVVAEVGALKAPIVASLQDIIAQADVVIDFTVATATVPLLQVVADAKKAAVIGTTGHNQDQIKSIQKAAQTIPILMAPNMSLGVNVLWHLITEAARLLGPKFPVEVQETHHTHKKDKPSGTALKMMEVLAQVLGKNRDDIPVQCFREGEVVGDHTAIFTGLGETLSLTHHAESRDIFALGAIRAAKWIVGKKPGLYDMFDVLGLKSLPDLDPRSPEQILGYNQKGTFF